MDERTSDEFIRLSNKEIHDSWSSNRPIHLPDQLSRTSFDPLTCLAGMLEVASLEDWEALKAIHRMLSAICEMDAFQVELETDRISVAVKDNRISPEGAVQLIHALSGIAIGVFSLGLGVSPILPQYDLSTGSINVLPLHFFLDYRRLLLFLEQVCTKSQHQAIIEQSKPAISVFKRLFQKETIPNEEGAREAKRQHDRYFNHTGILPHGIFNEVLDCCIGDGASLRVQREETKRIHGASIFWAFAGHCCFRGSEKPIISIFDYLLGKDTILALSFLGCATKSGHLNRQTLAQMIRKYIQLSELSPEDKRYFLGLRPDLALNRLSRPPETLLKSGQQILLSTGAYAYPSIHSGHLGPLNLMTLEQGSRACFVPTKHHAGKPLVNESNFYTRCGLLAITAGSWEEEHMVTATMQPDPPLTEDVFITYAHHVGPYHLVVGADKPLDPRWIERMVLLTKTQEYLSGLKVLARVPTITSPSDQTSPGTLEKALNRVLDLNISDRSLVFAPGMTFSSSIIRSLYAVYQQLLSELMDSNSEVRIKWPNPETVLHLSRQQAVRMQESVRQTIFGIIIPIQQSHDLGLTNGFELKPEILRQLNLPSNGSSV